MSDLAVNLGREIFKHQMTKGELLEANNKIQQLEAQLISLRLVAKNKIELLNEAVEVIGLMKDNMQYIEPEYDELDIKVREFLAKLKGGE